MSKLDHGHVMFHCAQTLSELHTPLKEDLFEPLGLKLMENNLKLQNLIQRKHNLKHPKTSKTG